MFNRLMNLLKGQVTGRIECGFPERVLNLCGEYGIPFWDIRWESPVAFTFTTTWRDWRRLRKLSRRLNCDMKAQLWRGAPFLLGRLRRRYALWVCMALCAGALFCGSFFIWDFTIEGAETVSHTEILRALERCGVGFGTFGYDVNSATLRNLMLLEVPRLSYFAINVRGCRAYIQVRERVDAPPLMSQRQQGNTVAAKDALVTDILPWDGEKQVLPGTMVKKGQLLISGVVENDFAGVRYVRGMGKVYGRTWYTLQCRVPLTKAEKVYTGEEKTELALVIGKNRVKIAINSSHTGDTCDKITSWKRWELPGGVALPVQTVTSRLQYYTLEETRRSREEAMSLAKLVLSARLEDCLDGGEVLTCAFDSREENDTLLVTLTAECREQIGQYVEIPKE